MLQKEFFGSFRCDRSISLGLNLISLSKILKCASKDDAITLKAEDGGDVLTLMFESKGEPLPGASRESLGAFAFVFLNLLEPRQTHHPMPPEVGLRVMDLPNCTHLMAV